MNAWPYADETASERNATLLSTDIVLKSGNKDKAKDE